MKPQFAPLVRGDRTCVFDTSFNFSTPVKNTRISCTHMKPYNKFLGSVHTIHQLVGMVQYCVGSYLVGLLLVVQIHMFGI